MGGRRSRPAVWAAVVVGVLVVVAAGIAANIALLDATDADGLGELTPVVPTDVRPAQVVTAPPPVQTVERPRVRSVEPPPIRTDRDDDDADHDEDRHSDGDRFDDD